MTVSAQVEKRVRSSGRRYWTTGELRERFDNAPAVRKAIQRLVDRGELQRVRRGLYWHPGKLRDGRVKVRRVRTAGTAARAMFDHREAIGASGVQAANVLGLSTQVSPVEVIAVTRRAPRAMDLVRFVDRSARRGRRDVRLDEMEVTILEALEGWDLHVELSGPAAARRFVELLKDERVRPKALAQAAATEPASVRERLRAVLEQGGWAAEARAVPRAVDQRTRDRALAVLSMA